MTLYNGDTFTQRGRKFTFATEWDNDQGVPWENDCCHGEVFKSPYAPGFGAARLDKAHVYDFRASIKKARKEWGFATLREAAIAVRQDFERLQAWCDDGWSYIGVVVADELTGETAALWGIESDAGNYLEEVARELADGLAETAENEIAETITASRPDMHCEAAS